jgi:hypothetical protein
VAIAVGVIKVDGLQQFSRALRRVDADAPKELRVIGNDAANIVAGHARPRVARKSGRAQRSIKASSTRTLSRVKGGGPRQPYYPWLEFGGRVGRKRSVKRRFIKSGRYIYPAYASKRAYVQARLTVGLTRLAERQGWDVKNG